MKVPKARKLSSGTWFIQLRLGGQSIPVTGKTEKACVHNAEAVKADWLAKKRLPEAQKETNAGLTVFQAIDAYIEKKSRVLSPSTVRGYRTIQKTRFVSTMNRKISEIKDSEWQGIVNAECALAAPKTVNNAFKFIRTVIRHEADREISMSKIRLPSVPPANAAFLQPEEIPIFVDAVKDLSIAVPALLALSSLRASEISALRWENIPKNPKFIQVRGAMVRDADSVWVLKKQNKNAASTRNVPILIPELAKALERDRKPSGPVMPCDQATLRAAVRKVCEDAGITGVSTHGLRHSFASLAYHLQIPEQIAMGIGGWSDPGTMRKIYTHIAKSDISRYQNALSDFYANKNANKNAK